MTEWPEMSPMPPRGEHLILYDGVCGLCNRFNQFVLPRDTGGIFDFAALQSAAAESALEQFGHDPGDLNTLYVVVNYRSESPVLLCKARAALFVITTLRGWVWLRPFGMIPSALLNRGYDLLARNRYRLFGQYDSCLMPSAEHKARFIDT